MSLTKLIMEIEIIHLKNASILFADQTRNIAITDTFAYS